VVRGLVVDEHGGPVPDAWVTATPEQMDDAESRFHRPDDSNERTGEIPDLPKDPDAPASQGLGQRGEPVLSGVDGRFIVSGLAHRTYTLRAEALRGSARAQVAGVVLGSDVKVQVLPLAELSGVVRSGGRPVVRYELQAQRTRGGGFSLGGDTIDRPDGAFHLDHLDPGEYKLTVTADAGRVEHTLTLASGERGEVSLELAPLGTLRGILLDRRTGAPIAGVVMFPEQKGSFPGGDILGSLLGKGPRTGADGRFEVGRVAPGEGTLRFIDRDFSDSEGIAQVPYKLAPGGVHDLGTVQGVSLARVPKAERGDLGLRLFVATTARRPRPPGEVAAPLSEPEDPAAVKHLYVVAVTVDGPADRAGVQPGDEVLTIDVASVASLGADNAARLLAPASIRRSQSVALELEQADARRSVALEAVARAKPR
jgi:hypothetical protein